MKPNKPKLHTLYKTEEGKRVPSVTTIIGQSLGWNKQVLIAWAAREAGSGNDPNKIKEVAGGSGTLAHAMIETDINEILGKAKTMYDLDLYTQEQISEALLAYDAFKLFKKDLQPAFIRTEAKLVSEKYRFGGTIDATGTINNKITLFDWKTSKGVYPEMKIQLAAYCQLYKEFTGKSSDKIQVYLVRFDKTGQGYELHKIKSIQLYWKAFKHCLQLYNLKKQIGR